MNRACLIFAPIAASILISGSPTLAVPPGGAHSAKNLLISEVFIDFSNELLVISGQGFNSGEAPSVFLGNQTI